MSDSQTLEPASVPATTRSRGRIVGLWALQLLAAALFLMAGGSKLAGTPEMIELFEAVGIGQWFRYFTGSLQAGGAILLLVPSLAGVGALVIAATMAGAVLTHLFVIGGSPLVPLALLALLGGIAYGRREEMALWLTRQLAGGRAARR